MTDQDDVAGDQASEETPAPDSAAEAGDATTDAATQSGPAAPVSGQRLALTVGVVAVVATAGLVGWLGNRAYQSYEAQRQRDLFVQVGRRAATYLTTISDSEAETDVQRILDVATGPFYDDFQKRAKSFTEVVKQARSNSEGTVTEAGLESETKDQGKVLVAVMVKTQNAGAPEQQPRAWRMRLTVQRVGNDAKVSLVEFVP